MNPAEQVAAPEEIPPRLIIIATREPNGKWVIVCSQWDYSGPATRLTEGLALIGADIEGTEAPFATRASTPLEKAIVRAIRCAPLPDPGTRTPIAGFWQART